MRLVTWNVNSFNVRRAQVEAFLREKSPDFLLLQETKTEKIPEDIFSREGYIFYHAGGKGRNGVGILSKRKASRFWRGFEALADDDPQARERLLGGQFGELFIFTIYVPNGSPVDSDYFYYKIQFLYRLREFLEKHFTPLDKIILAGDFNVSPEPEDVYDPQLLDGQICFHPRERKAFKYLLEWGLWDSLRLKYPDKGGIFTWWDYQFSAFKKNLGMRLDHILITTPLKDYLKDVWVDFKTRGLPKPSDHAPLIADFEDKIDI
ncbi:exodeoxyribonuclease III [Caldimicrobium thiodismutans]|uniref:Exodeoxyribonuclease III n=1 Tax=Caldimicrobium thiodismutans TaxID=1653476 RepID=A0A0U5AF82_9BACT|nr:exodeoxyribonuclease III [Caldimicrobium thiodismutans]BAU22668.1 exodeoxyribonuclease III [Caldimicrobium thiodismutans]